MCPAGLVLAVAGCATQDQLRQTEAQQGQAVQVLRAEANRSEGVIAALRADIKRAQETAHGLEVALTDARARTDSAKAQADSALATSREFLPICLRPPRATALIEQLRARIWPFQVDATSGIPQNEYVVKCNNPDGLLSVNCVFSALKNADLAMYRAKHGGGGQFRFHTTGSNGGALERMELESDLRHPLDRGDFELHYQPRVELRSGLRVTSVEALIRWRREGQGLISPAKFIPLAEETGLIVAIGDWVLRTACAQMRTWALSGHADMRVAVNLSARQFREPGLLERVGEILAETNLETRHLEIEITESMAMQDPAHTRALLERFNNMGIAIAIDDFGTGYSSLAYLKRFPIDYLKIDQSFVRGIPADKDDASIIRAIIALGKSLELILIAEGVETEAQREFLRAEGCDEMQGYLYSRPVPADDLGKLLRGRIHAAASS